MTPLSSKLRPRLWALLIVAVTVFAHGASIQGGLVYQDGQIAPHAAVEGAQVASALQSALQVISEPNQHPETLAWEPVPILIRALSPLFGDHQARGLHAFSLLIQVLCVLALLRLAQSLGSGQFAARAAALLFGLHPLTVQSTAWISAMGASLACGFALFALDAFERSRAQNRISPLSGILLLLALLSNPLALAALPVALYLFCCPLNGDAKRSAPRSLIPFASALLLAWCLGAAAYGSFSTGLLVRAASSPFAGLQLVQSQLAVIGSAFSLFLWPGEQTLFRPTSTDTSQALIGLAIVLFACCATLVIRRRVFEKSVGLFRLSLLAITPLAIATPWMLVYPLSDEHLILALALFLIFFAKALAQLPNPIRLASLAVISGLLLTTTLSWVPTWKSNTTLLKRAAEAAPNLPFAQWNYAYALLDQYAKSADPNQLTMAMETIERAQNLLDASKLADSTISATPLDFVRTNLALGWCLLSQVELDGYQDYGTPKQVFETIIAARPENVEAHIGLGISALAAGSPEAAEAAFLAALSLDSNSVEARRKLGGFYIAAERWREAQEQFERLLLVQPSDLQSRIWLTRALIQQGALQSAEEQAQLAHNQVPIYPEPMVLLGILQLKQNRPSKALDWIDRALRSDPEDGFARLQRGHAFEALGEIQNAMVEFKRAADRLPDSFEAFYSLGNSLLAMQQPAVAAEQFVRAYELADNPAARRALRNALAQAFRENTALHFRFASIDFQREDYEATRFWVDLVLESDPEHAGSLHLSGVLNRLAGKSETALADFKAALEVLPDSFQVNHDLGYLLVELNRPFEAVPYLRRARDLVPAIPEAPEGPAKLRQKIETTLNEIRGN